MMVENYDLQRPEQEGKLFYELTENKMYLKGIGIQC